MKRKLTLLLFAAALICSGCYNEAENAINQLDRRLENVRKACDQLNTNISSLQQLVNTLNSYDFVKKVSTVTGSSGEVLGYEIQFTNNAPITIYNGTSSETPIIGIKLDPSDEIYYWTVKYEGKEEEFIRNSSGGKIAATASSPMFRIVDGKWEVSYDGTVWRTNYDGSEFGPATGDSPQSFFAGVSDYTDYVLFTFVDSSSIKVPSWTAYETLVSATRTVNNNLNALTEAISLMNAQLYVKDVMPIVSNGDTTGHVLTFSDGRSVSLYNGVATNRPIISAERDAEHPSDSNYYWTVKYSEDAPAEWILLYGGKIRANGIGGVVPLLAAHPDTTVSPSDGLYYWMISYNGGASYEYLTSGSRKIQASVANNITSLDSTVVTQDYVKFKVGSNWYSVARFEDFDVTIDKPVITMGPSQTETIRLNIPSGQVSYSVLPVTSDNFYAEAYYFLATHWMVTVTSPATFTSGSSVLTLLVSNGKGITKTYSVTINYGS